MQTVNHKVSFKEVAENVSNLRYYRSCYASICEMIDDMYPIAAYRIDEVGIQGKGSVSRKTENAAIRSIELNNRKRQYKKKIDLYENAIKRTPLYGEERELIDFINENGGGNLAQYAREKGYGASYVYKVRDRAMKRIRDYINK